MLGAGSAFSQAVLKDLCEIDIFKENTNFIMVDIAQDRLEKAFIEGKELIAKIGARIKLDKTLDRRQALDGADYVITACEKNRAEYWLKDIQIPQKHGVFQAVGENGGPGGQFHAARNIFMFMDIVKDMEELCPDAWLMNFTNPMSFLCTYLNRYTQVKSVGICHQAHGSFGVVAEMLGMEPGELEVVSGGINHLNWLIDVRRRGTGQSYLEEFLQAVRESPYWQKNFNDEETAIPEQKLTLEVLEIFGAYPIGYDNHIVEFLPFPPGKEEMDKYFYENQEARLLRWIANQNEVEKQKANVNLLDAVELRTKREVPFPKEEDHPYYREKTCLVMEALETNSKAYIDSIVIPNQGAISNLPTGGIVDVPAVVAGGMVRGVYVGELPPGAAEICRRQMTIHELLVRAVVEGDRNLLLQSLVLDPYVHTLTQAKGLMEDMLNYYQEELPTFFK